MAQQQAYYNNPHVVCQPFFSLFQKKSRFLPGKRAIDAGAFTPGMVAKVHERESLFFHHYYGILFIRNPLFSEVLYAS